MRAIKAWPFLSLAAFTLVVGVVFHLVGVTRTSPPLGAAFFWFSAVIGSPFIGGMTLATRTVSISALRPLVGLIIGLLPYVAAEILLRRYRSAKKAS
ncbi:MAG TPA: hypothetical protein VF483_11880 [Gemmatimonadaceae bacterium]